MDSKTLTEQWNLSGDCSICRRNKYCSHPCTKRKRVDRAVTRSMVADMMNIATGGIMKEAIEKTTRDYIW